MFSFERKLAFGEAPITELRQVLAAKTRELIEEFLERLPLAIAELRETIKGDEPSVWPLCENDFRPWNPVSALAVNEMSDDVVRTPSVRTLVGDDPLSRNAGQHRAYRPRRSMQNRYSAGKIEIHGVSYVPRREDAKLIVFLQEPLRFHPFIFWRA